MKKIYILIIVVITSCQFNSSNEKNDAFDGEIFSNSRNIKSEELKIIPDSLLMFPVSILINKENLIVNDPESEGVFHIVQIPEEKYLGNFGGKGSGPGEVLTAWGISNSEKENITVYDLMQKKIVEFNLDTLMVNGKFIKEYKLSSKTGHYTKIVNGDKLYSLYGFDNKNILNQIDLGTNRRKTFGNPFELSFKIDEKIKERIYMSSMDKKGNLIVISYMFTPRIEIFNLKTNTWKAIEGPQIFKPKFFYKKNSNGTKHISFKKDLKIAYTTIRITKKRIYALYNGRSEKGIKGEHSNIIFVFDLDGNILEKITLDKGILSFDVYLDEYIYGVNSVEKPMLLKFKL